MRVDELTGDSTVSDMQFSDGIASLLYEDSDSGLRFRVCVPTNSLFSEASTETGSVHVRLVSLADLLPIDPISGRYSIPNNFGVLMTAIREAGHLALGRRATDYPTLLQVRGYRILLACPIRSAEDVTVLPE